VAVDYTKQNFEDVARDVDVVLDSVGKDTLARSYGVVKKGGFIATLVARLIKLSSINMGFAAHRFRSSERSATGGNRKTDRRQKNQANRVRSLSLTDAAKARNRRRPITPRQNRPEGGGRTEVMNWEAINAIAQLIGC